MIENCSAEVATMVELLRLRALESPGRRALTFLANGEAEAGGMTYGELDARARAIAARLQGLAGSGERALLLYPPGLEMVAAFFGCLYADVVAVPLFPPRPNRPLPRLQSVARDARATLALTTSDVYDDLQRCLRQAPELSGLRWLATDQISETPAWREPALESDSLAYLQYTSGSTSTPKGVMVTHENLLENERMLVHAWGNHEDATIVSWLPLYHDMGLIGVVLQSIYTAAHCVLMPPVSFLQQPLRWLKAVSRYRARFSGGPNFAYDLCARKVTAEQKAGLDLSGWEVAFSGSEPIRAETLRRFAAAFGPCGFRWDAFCPGYGLAEATLAVSSCRWTDAPAIRRSESQRPMVGCGAELPGSRVAIVNPETGARCRPGQEGEIWVAGPHVACGYWGRLEESLETFGARLAETGDGPFLRTGDLGFLLGGELHVSGRLKDLIILDGRNLYPQDVEETVEACHLALRTAGGAAFSVDDGEQERLVVVHEVDRHARQDELAEIVAAVRQAVAEEHDARVWRVCLIHPGTLPKTSSGKVQRQACRAAFLADSLETVQ